MHIDQLPEDKSRPLVVYVAMSEPSYGYVPAMEKIRSAGYQVIVIRYLNDPPTISTEQPTMYMVKSSDKSSMSAIKKMCEERFAPGGVIPMDDDEFDEFKNNVIRMPYP